MANPEFIDPDQFPPNPQQRDWFSPGGMFGTYAATPGVYDEVYQSPGVCRPHWFEYLNGVQQLGPREFTRRWDEARRQIQENGIAYNVYNKDKNSERVWPADPIPLIIPEDEWRRVEAGLIQRATLLNCILADLYGPQRLIREQLLPVQLIYANPGFLRPCFGRKIRSGGKAARPGSAKKPGPNRWLYVCAASIARAGDGRWWVIGDHTQAPSSAGYALENRLILARAYPELFRSCNVRRLAQFFKLYRAALNKLASAGAEMPRIVVLTPGPYNETYSEHSFIARYLGYPLVEGSDLTVRDNQVFLKTLEGLLRVNVIIRRMDDDYCDPLELRADSLLGVAGLTQAERAGNVKIVNPLGSGLLEAPAFIPFLPALCRFFLQEELLLPSVATWWCGQEDERRYVFEHFDQLIIKPAFPRPSEPAVFTERLSQLEREQLQQKIARQPWDYVAQERFSNSVVPAWNDQTLTPSHFILRTHLAFDGEHSYRALPGGMTRVPGQGDILNFTMQRGGVSKDTWILTSQPERELSLLPRPGDPVPVQRFSRHVPSRIADHLFWLGRYAERAELTTRIVRAIAERVIGETELDLLPELNLLLRPLRDRLGDRMLTQPSQDPHEYRYQLETLLEIAIFNTEPYEGLIGTLQRLRHNAWSVRDRISTDWWRILNLIEHELDPQSQYLQTDWPAMLDKLNRLIISLSSFGGYVLESMTRGHGWMFLELGRRIEHAIGLAGFLDHCLSIPIENESAALQSVFEICDCQISYRTRYFYAPEIETALDLLIVDESNPRSIAFQLERIEDYLKQLPRMQTPYQLHEEQKLALGLLSVTRLAVVRDWCAIINGSRANLSAYLHKLINELGQISALLNNHYFSHSKQARHARLAGKIVDSG